MIWTSAHVPAPLGFVPDYQGTRYHCGRWWRRWIKYGDWSNVAIRAEAWETSP